MVAEPDFREIRYRLENHGTFKLFRKERAALMPTFFLDAFKKGHRSDIPRSALVSELSAFCDYLTLVVGADAETRSAAALLDEWADDGFLRKYYRSDESEKAIEWLRELSDRRFVGAESRLFKVFDLMKDIAYGAAFDAAELALYRRLGSASGGNRLEQERIPLGWARERLRAALSSG